MVLHRIQFSIEIKLKKENTCQLIDSSQSQSRMATALPIKIRGRGA